MKTILACVVTALIVVTATATAASLITGSQIADNTIHNHNIHKNTITSNRLSPGLQTLIKRSAQSGANGAVGAVGPKGDTGATGAKGDKGDTGAKGDTGNPGTNGTNGISGLNPATPVLASGDAGWTVGGSGNGGAGVNAATNTASFRGGAVHLPGGFDSTTFGGAIGIVHPYSSVPLSSLSSLSYDWVVNHLASGDQDSPSVHITVLGAVQSQPTNCTSACTTQGDSKFASGFTNLVYTPLYNGLGGVHATTADVVNGGLLWSSGNLSNGSGTQAQPIPLAAFAARNPDAKIVQISFDNGGTSGAGSSASSDTDISIDNGVVGFGSTFTRYDFGG